MKDLNILILYKNKRSKIVNVKKLKKSHLLDENIETILIPLYDNPNAYIPIKSSYLYNFDKAYVELYYQAFIYDYEDEKGISFDIQKFSKKCNNIIDFINAIYNCYKFRGVTLYLENSYQITTSQSSNLIVVLREVNIKFYDKNDNVYAKIESGVMKDLSDYHYTIFRKTPPSYICEDRLNCLKDILYVPNDIDGTSILDVDKLPLCIQLLDDDRWKTVKKSSTLLNSDYILYKIPDFEVYYLMEYKLYLNLLSFEKFNIHYISTPIDTSVMDENYLPSMDNNKIPSIIEKEEVYDAFYDDNLFSIVNAEVLIYSIDTLIESLIFFKTIMNYIKYFGIYCYAGNSEFIKVKNFALFCKKHNEGDFHNTIVLTEIELDYDSINDTFIKMITGGKY